MDSLLTLFQLFLYRRWVCAITNCWRYKHFDEKEFFKRPFGEAETQKSLAVYSR